MQLTNLNFSQDSEQNIFQMKESFILYVLEK